MPIKNIYATITNHVQIVGYREIGDRLDQGNTILSEMNTKLDKLDKLDVLDGISGKLDTLPEKIAEALKR